MQRVNKIGTGTISDPFRPDMNGLQNISSVSVVEEHAGYFMVEVIKTTDAPSSPPDFGALMVDIASVDLDSATTVPQLKAAIKLKFQRIEKALKARWGINGNGFS